MPKNLVAIRILDLPGSGGGCGCGSSQPILIGTLVQKCAELKKALEASFPGRTSTEYVDISKVPKEKETEAGKLLVSKQYPSPLVVINGEAHFAGSIQVNQVVEAVRKILNP